MANPRFSIVVPTRERAETLHFALLTILDQDFDDYEIVVHDNCSSPATREVVERHQSDKIKYFRSDAPLAMTDSWERALSFAKGEYVMVIGDDDGLLPHALRILQQLLTSLSLPIIRWSRVSYHWPNHLFPVKRNSLKIPTGNNAYFIPGRAMIKMVVEQEMPFQNLPMLYNSVVHRDLIAAIRQKCGRVFLSAVPDLASGYALAYESKRYLSIESPMSIGGTSGKSNGLATLGRVQSGGGSEVAEDYARLNGMAGLAPHRKLPAIDLMAVIVADPFCHVKDLLFPDDPLSLDRKKLILRCVNELRWVPTETNRDALRLMRESLKDESRLQAWFDREAAGTKLSQPEKAVLARPPRGFLEREKIIGLDTVDFGVTDVYGAAKLCEKILNYNRDGFRCDIREYFASPYRQLRSIARTLLRRGAPTLPDCD